MVIKICGFLSFLYLTFLLKLSLKRLIHKNVDGEKGVGGGMGGGFKLPELEIKKKKIPVN